MKIRTFSTSSFSRIHEVVIVSAVRTPVGSFRGSLSSLSAPELGGYAGKAAIQSAGVKPSDVGEVFFGNVLSANLGQAPASQVAHLSGLISWNFFHGHLISGLPNSVPCTLVNKVCASGLKAIMLGAQSIALGHQDVVLAGGMESMSNAPYYMDKARSGFGYGHQQVTDSIIKDGLWDAQYQTHMGNCAEETAEKFEISRQEQDEHAVASYRRSAEAVAKGIFSAEIVPVPVNIKGKVIHVSEDEEFKKVNFEKIPGLKPVFKMEGSVTAANASTLNDGASAVILMSATKAKCLSLKPLAFIRGFADANRDPKEFTIAPADAIPKVLKQCNLSLNDISLFEINEAFSVVVRANEKILGLDPTKVNIAGGGVSLGHPIGSSGCRILVTLLHLLKPGKLGCAAICNGGGGASTMIIEKVQ